MWEIGLSKRTDQNRKVHHKMVCIKELSEEQAVLLKHNIFQSVM
jgi:hypothetical protein